MSWIEGADSGDLPAVFQVLSRNSEALEAVRTLNEALAFGNSTLSRVQEEAIATVVSVVNRCRYGALTHGGFLRRHSEDPALASQLLFDYAQAPLQSRDRLMLDFAVRLTQEPASMTEEDVMGLREAGFDDRDIVSIVLVACLSNFMNRVACGLGVDVPLRYQRAVGNWLTGPASRQAWLRPATEDLPPDPDEDEAQTPNGETWVSTAVPKAGVEEDKEGGTSSFKEGIHPVQRFVEECCLVSQDQTSTARDLYAAYLRWCEENRQTALARRNFGLALSRLGFGRRRGQGRHWRTGVGLATGDD